MTIKKECIPEYAKMGLSTYTFAYNTFEFCKNTAAYETCKFKHDHTHDSFERATLFGEGMIRKGLSIGNLIGAASSVLMFIDSWFKLDNKKKRN